MAVKHVSPKTALACLLAMIAALLAREVASAHLLNWNIDLQLARDLSYLVVPLVLCLLLFPLFRQQRGFQFIGDRLDIRFN